MSIMAKSNVYGSMVEDGGLNDKLCFATCEATRQFMFMPKIESNTDPNMLDAPETMVDQKNVVLNDGIMCDTYNSTGEPVYYEESLNSCEEIEIEYKPTFPSLTLREPKMEDEWEENNQYDSSPMQKTSFEENETITHYDAGETIEDPDEETIATFLTAAGQRLALYAVEDSDEVFAVAVYDESGEPPTNFQFLMKSDVERLIGEGAVRTIKKPTQIKKQLFPSDPLVFAHDTEGNCDQNPLRDELVYSSQYKNKQHDAHNPWKNVADLESNEIEPVERKPSPLSHVNEQPVFAYVTMENTSTILPSSPIHEFDRPMKNIEQKSEVVEDKYNDAELVEQSTVQNLFMDNEKSDDELTFADIEETLRDFGKKDHPPSVKKISPSQSLASSDIMPSIDIDPSIDVPSSISVSPSIDVTPSEDHQVLNGIISVDSYCDDGQRCDASTEDIVIMNALKKPEKNKSVARKTQLSSSLICRRANYNNNRPTVSGTSLLIGNNEAKSIMESNSTLEIVQISSKVKRPRKQQLTSVNRGDSEIIIQPATFPNEDDENMKKRGRRKRKTVRSPVYKSKTSAKKVKRARRRRRPRRPVVEVIEIDLDEENETEAGSAKKTIVEITIDENKEKGSSDKENEVIMVGDSDEETEQLADASNTSSSILKCKHCSRSFRQRRALDTHSRICPKSPDTMRRLKERSSRRNLTRLSNDDMPVAKKEFLCKICQEKFDVVVALARHVRFIHSLKKKTANQTMGMNKANEETLAVETTPATTEPIESISEIAPAMIVAPTTRRRRKRRKANSPNHSWKGQKLHCTDCGKWFSSDALLAAHCLQHATKQSPEKQLRRCQTCKKLLKSRLLYIRHMKMHSRAKKLQKRLHHTRQAAGKLSSLRTRGRPQKL